MNIDKAETQYDQEIKKSLRNAAGKAASMEVNGQMTFCVVILTGFKYVFRDGIQCKCMFFTPLPF